MVKLKIKKGNILTVINKYIFIPLISGLFISLSFPKYFIPFSFLIGFFFFFKSFVEDNLKRHLLTSFLIGFFFSFFSFNWLTYSMEMYINTNFILANLILIFFCIVFSVYQFVSFSLILYFLKKLINNNVLLISPFIWVLIEITREFFPFTGFPWNLVGYTLSPINEIAQVSSLGGVYLLSLIAIYLALGIFYFFYFKNFRSFSFLIIIIFIFIAIYIYGSIRIDNFQINGIKKKVALIQGNISQDEKLDKSKKEYVLNKYINLIKKADSYNPDLIILPESSLPFAPSYIDNLYIQFFTSLRNIKTKALLIGIDDIFINDIDIKIFNTFTLFNNEGKVLDQYRKIKLVPFGEYTPEPFKIFNKLIPYLSTGIDFSQGKKKRIIIYQDFKIIPLICFESIFPYFVADFSKNGNLIVNTTNDAWFGNTSAPYQHFEMARLRAIETGKYIIRVANTGISAIITPTGKIEKSLSLNKTGILVGYVYLIEGKTFFVKHLKSIYIIYLLAPFILTFIFYLVKIKKEKINKAT